MDKELMTVMLKMILSLAVVLAVFGLGVFAFRKFAGKSRGFLKPKGMSAKPMEILAFQSLGPGRNVYLIRCLDRKVLVGATNTQISHLADITEEETDSDEDSFNSVFNEKGTAKSENGIKSQISNSLREIARV